MSITKFHQKHYNIWHHNPVTYQCACTDSYCDCRSLSKFHHSKAIRPQNFIQWNSTLNTVIWWPSTSYVENTWKKYNWVIDWLKMYPKYGLWPRSLLQADHVLFIPQAIHSDYFVKQTVQTFLTTLLALTHTQTNFIISCQMQHQTQLKWHQINKQHDCNTDLRISKKETVIITTRQTEYTYIRK